MEFKEYLKIRSVLIELLEDKKFEVKSCNLTQSFSSDWGTLKHKSSSKDHSRASLINNRSFVSDLPLRINSVSEPVLFVDDTSVIISGKNVEGFFHRQI